MSNLPKTLPYHIFEQIRGRIIRGEYGPGTALREHELEREFGSSRGPVRESLRLLELKGLTVHSPRRGFRVRSSSPQELTDLYNLRAELESLVIVSLSEKPLKETIALLRQNLKAMERHFNKGDINAYFDENIRFHSIMVEATQNEPLKRVLDIVNEMSLPIRYFVLSKRFAESKSLRYHKEITAALEKGDFKKAREITRQDIISNLDFLKSAAVSFAEAAQ
jgi:DNA-binding GntR family transcriptional regulator